MAFRTQTSERGSVHFTSTNILKKLKELYSTLEFFFLCFVSTTEGSTVFNQFVHHYEEKLKVQHNEEIQDACHLGRLEATEAIQNQFNLVSLELQVIEFNISI